MIKNKNNNLINHFFCSTYFKTIFLLLTFLSLFSLLTLNTNDYVLETSFYTLNNPFDVLILFFAFLANAFYLQKYYFSSSFLILRTRNKKSFNKLEFISTININLIYFLYYCIISLFFSSIKCFGSMSIELYKLYQIPLIFYYIFYIIRLFVVLSCLCEIGRILIKRFYSNYLYLIIYIIFVIASCLLTPYRVSIISSISEMPLEIIYYLVGLNCEFFVQEICFSCLYLFILVIVIYGIRLILCNKGADYHV